MNTMELLLKLLDPEKRKVDRFGYVFLRQLNKIVCVDGFTMSVQASEAHYCQPRDNKGPWHTVEVGYPSEREVLFMTYAEDKKHPTDTVYAGIPIDLVVTVIDKHGGMI